MTPDDKRRLAKIDARLGRDPLLFSADFKLLRRLLDEATAERDAAMAALREPPVEMVNYIRETSYRDGFFSLRPSLKAAADWIEHNTLAAHSAATNPTEEVSG